MPDESSPPDFPLWLKDGIIAIRKHAAFAVFIALDVLFLLVIVGLQSRHLWSIRVADYAYVVAGIVLVSSYVEIYHGHRR